MRILMQVEMHFLHLVVRLHELMIDFRTPLIVSLLAMAMTSLPVLALQELPPLLLHQGAYLMQVYVLVCSH